MHPPAILRGLLAASVIMLAACGPAPKVVSDPYDASKIELKSPPATLTAARHTGPFSKGDSLNFDAQLKPLDPAPIKYVQLDTSHKLVEIAPGVKFSAWTFGDQVPGPTVRARVGDKIHFSMTNRSDETLPAMSMVVNPGLKKMI